MKNNLFSRLDKEVAQTLGLSEEQVSSIAHHQWKNLVANAPHHPSLEITSLGSFRVKLSRVEKRIELLNQSEQKYLSLLTTAVSEKELNLYSRRLCEIQEQREFILYKQSQCDTPKDRRGLAETKKK